MDDFAIRKRYTYGTIMIDIKTHRVVDLIQFRDSKDVTAWLKGYPNLRVVSRDGSVSYASAIRKVNPEIIVVTTEHEKNLCKKLSLVHWEEYVKK